MLTILIFGDEVTGAMQRVTRFIQFYAKRLDVELLAVDVTRYPAMTQAYEVDTTPMVVLTASPEWPEVELARFSELHDKATIRLACNDMCAKIRKQL